MVYKGKNATVLAAIEKSKFAPRLSAAEEGRAMEMAIRVGNIRRNYLPLGVNEAEIAIRKNYAHDAVLMEKMLDALIEAI